MSASVAAPGSREAGPDAFRVGRWRVEAPLNELRSGDTVVRIEPKATAVLLFLAARPGQVVSREALLQAAWPGVVVGDDALTQVVVKLRKALGDDPRDPAFIETIAKGGYRLVAPVVHESNEGSVQVARFRGARYAIAAAVGVGAIALAAWFLLGGPPGAAPKLGTKVLATVQQPTVTVVPFETIGNDPDEALLARGIANDLLTDLSRMPGLWVRHERSAAESQSDGHYVVTGTVQRSADRVRLNVHLSEARTGRQLWSERFDRPLGDLFETQDELGPRILAVLPVKVGEAERRRIAHRYTRNFAAYETFQRAQAALHVRRRDDNEAARELFRRAVAMDPAFARAHAGLAMTYAAEYRNRWVANIDESLATARSLAIASNELDAEIPETHWVLAFVDSHRHDHESALRHLDTALRINPSFADAHALMGGILTSLGRPAEALPRLRTAVRLAPESGYLYLMLLGRAQLLLGDHAQARLTLEQALARNPEFLDARVYLAAVHVASGDRRAAAWEAEEIRALDPGFKVRRWLETNPTADGPLKDLVIARLSELGF